jgi:hypothetical protein
MNIDWKKIALITGFIALILFLSLAIYFVFFRTLIAPPEVITPTTPGTPTGTLPTTTGTRPALIDGSETGGGANNQNPTTGNAITPESVEAFIDEPAYFATPTTDGGIIYYSSDKDKFYQVSVSGTVTTYDNKAFYNVSNVNWSPDRNRAVLEYPDGSNIVYDFTTGKQITLPAHWQDFSFSPTNGQIAFKSIALDPNNRFLAVSNYDGTGSKTIDSLGTKGSQFEVNWSPNNQMVANFTEGKDGTRSEVFFIGLNNENFKAMTVEGYDFNSIWSPKGDKMVYSVYTPGNNYKPELWIADVSTNSIGDNRQRLNLETWGDKCVFADDTRLLCAVPTSLPFGAGLDRTSANNTSDSLYEINLATGARRTISTGDKNYTIDKIIATPNSDDIFFTDVNNQLYRIDL